MKEADNIFLKARKLYFHFDPIRELRIHIQLQSDLVFLFGLCLGCHTTSVYLTKEKRDALFKEGAAAFYSILDYFQTLALCSQDVFSLSVKTL